MKKLLLIFILPLITFSQETIKMEKDNNLWLIPGEINGKENRDCRFVFDPQTDGVIINNNVLVTMLHNETISTSDINGHTGEITTYEIEDNVNNIVGKLEVNINEIIIGQYNVLNLTASVSDQISAPIILGQSFLSQFPAFYQDEGNLILNPLIRGCTNWGACNYNSEATEDDGSCVYQDMYYDCDGICLNDMDDDGICDELEVEGCTDSNAYNYTQSATEDDGSCFYLIYGCTDIDAINYNPEATINDGSCNYVETNKIEDSVLETLDETINTSDKVEKIATPNTTPATKIETNISWSSYSNETTENKTNTNKKIKTKKKDDGKDHVLSYNLGWKYFNNCSDINELFDCAGDINNDVRIDDFIFNLTYSKNTPRLGFYLNFQTKKHHHDTISAESGYHVENDEVFKDNIFVGDLGWVDYGNYELWGTSDSLEIDRNFSYSNIAFGGGLTLKLLDEIPLWISLGIGLQTVETFEFRKLAVPAIDQPFTKEFLWVRNDDYSWDWEGYYQIGLQYKLFNRIILGYRVITPFSVLDKNDDWEKLESFIRHIKYGSSFSVGLRLF